MIQTPDFVDVMSALQTPSGTTSQAVKRVLQNPLIYGRAEIIGKLQSMSVDTETALVELLWKPNREGYAARQESTKFGRWLRRLLPPSVMDAIQDHEIELWVNEWAAACAMVENDKHPMFELLKGEDLRKAYHYYNYTSLESTQLHSSCMRYERCQPYLNIYVENPDVCQLLVTRDDDGKIKSRTLIWTSTTGVTMYDRIYASDRGIRTVESYCRAQGWVSTEEADGEVYLQRARHEYYPYLDSMYGLRVNSDGSGTLVNGESDYELRSTEGGPFHLEGYSSCADCGGSYDEDDMTYVSEHGEVCDGCLYRYTYCDDCDEWRREDFHRVQHLNLRWGTSYTSNVCDSCVASYSSCEVCDDLVGESAMQNLQGDVLCTACYERKAVECSDCNDTHYREELREGRCEACAENVEEAEEAEEVAA